MPTDHVICTAMNDKGMEYFQQRQKRLTQMAEAPHHHVWAAMVQNLVATCETTNLPPACRDDLANIEQHANRTDSPIDLQDWAH
eukprot:15432040-Heterocapsa_arctica.AAC.1